MKNLTMIKDTDLRGVNWKCENCQTTSGRRIHLSFKTPREFAQHLREYHLSREGGSFVCLFGPTGICPSLPAEGVSDRDYEEHVLRSHIHPQQVAAYSLSLSSNNNILTGRSNVPVPESARTYPEIRRRQQAEAAAAGVVGGAADSGSSSEQCSPSGSQVSMTASSIVDPLRWTVYHSVVNLPAALNDPKRRHMDIFSRTWGDSFERAEVIPSPLLPKITNRHFDFYKKHILGNRLSRKTVTLNEEEESKNSRALEALHAHTELETIPRMYFSGNFQLSSPETFETVLPWSHFRKIHGHRQLQERLTHHLDVVEVHIARQVSRKSSAFFQAVTSHDEIRERLGGTLSQVAGIRYQVQRLEKENLNGPLKILRLARQRENYAFVYRKLKLMHTVHTAQPTIQTLLSACDFCGALDLIATTQEILQTELAGVHAFRHLDSQLAEMARFVDKMVQAEFTAAIQNHLAAPIVEPEQRPGSTEDSDPDAEEAEEQLVPCLLGMLRIQRFNFTEVYRLEATQRLKDAVKQLVVKAVSSAELEQDPDAISLAEQMRQLDYSAWTPLFSSVCRALALLARRSCAACRQMELAVARAAAPDSDVPLQQDTADTLQNELRQLGVEIGDAALERAAKLLAARARDGFVERLSASQFVELQKIAEQLVRDTEDGFPVDRTAAEQNGQTAANLLTSALQGQATKLVSRFHDERRTKLSLILDNERWRMADVPLDFQRLAQYVHSSGRLRLPPASEDAVDASDQEHPPAADYLTVGDERYAVVGTALMLLKMLVEYCAAAEDLVAVAPDLLLRLVDLLKLFNSRTCQLVLGAGAIQLVGLNTITTKNLCLASRCLQLVLHFLPYVRTHFEYLLSRHAACYTISHPGAPRGGPLRHLDNITKDYRDHVSEISGKLLYIMEGKMEAVVVRWEVRPPVPSVPIRDAARHLRKLQEAIAELLPLEQVRELLLRVHSAFKGQLRSRLQALGVSNNNGPQHALVTGDMAFYLQSLQQLPGLQSFQDDFLDLWTSSTSASSPISAPS